MTDNAKTLRLGPWPKGINNRTDETTLKRSELRAATNVDLTARGNPSTRSGTQKKFAGAGMHSGFYNPRFPFLLAVNGNALCAYDLALNQTTVRSGLKPMAAVSYAEVNGTVYWSNGFDQGKVSRDLVDHPFGFAGPQGAPTLTPTTGALTAGQYQVACTFQSTTGEESGSTLAAVVNVSAQGGITVSNIPQPADPYAMFVRVYVGTADDEVLYWHRDVPVGMSSITIGNFNPGNRGKTLETQWLRVMPPGQIVRYVNGRLWVAAGPYVYHGAGMHYGLYRAKSDFIQYADSVTLMEPVGQAGNAGVYIASGKRTYFVQGADPKTAQLVIAHAYGAVPGSGLTVPAHYFDPELSGEAAFWIDSNYQPVLGLQGGQVRVLAANTYLGPTADSGSTMVRDINGIRQVICNMRGTAANVARASDSMVATVNRNGIAV